MKLRSHWHPPFEELVGSALKAAQPALAKHRIVKRRGELVHLTPIEYRLLAQLIANAGRVLTHRQILRDVWGPSHVESPHYVRVYMGHLREKLEDDPAQPKHLITETAVGYRLVV